MTQAEIKLAKSLSQNKYRKEHQAYLIEGDKLVQEWIKFSPDIKWIICTQDYFDQHSANLHTFQDKIKITPYFNLEKISNLSTAPPIMAVVNMPSSTSRSINTQQSWHLVLDRIQDPGNLGTIMRLADWLGMSEIILSPQSVDIYNPKVLQSTMGSFLRVKVIEMTLEDVITHADKPTVGTILKGQSLLEFEDKGIDKAYLFIGNESHGLPTPIIEQLDYNITLPSLNGQAESLNVAIATSMICSRLMY